MNQETPNFETYKNRFNAFILPDLTDNANQPVSEPHREIITSAYEKIGTYFTEDDFRHTLSLQRRNNIESNINATLDQFQQLQNFITSQPPQLAANIENISNNIQAYLEEIDLRFWTPFQVYLLQDKQDITKTVESIKKSAREVEAAKSSSEQTLKAAGILVSLSAEAEVANSFQRSVNGLDTEENDMLIKKKNRKKGSYNNFHVIFAFLIVSLILWLGASRISEIIKGFDSSNIEHYIYIVIFLLLISAYPISMLIKWIQETRPSGFERSATIWLIGAVISVLGTGLYAAILLSSFTGSSELTELVPKIISLLAPAYLIRFCTQNYRANKHLASLNSQKAIIARSVLAYTQNLSTSDESLKSQNNAFSGEIQKNIANIVFDPGETGFITTKEGAGSNDTIFQGSGIDKVVGK